MCRSIAHHRLKRKWAGIQTAMGKLCPKDCLSRIGEQIVGAGQLQQFGLLHFGVVRSEVFRIEIH
jgi:hypothetical protein